MTVQYGTRSLSRGKIDAGRGIDKLPPPDLATAPLGTDEEAAGAPAMHKEIAQARSTEHAFAAQTSWSGASSFLVAVIVLIGGIILIGASFISALWN
jgi:hypothetical protein